MAFDCLFHDIPQKLGAAMTSSESGSLYNFPEVLADGDGVSPSLCGSGLSWPFFARK